jgi:hypothetical protein
VTRDKIIIIIIIVKIITYQIPELKIISARSIHQQTEKQNKSTNN